jgi:hypothetical protein
MNPEPSISVAAFWQQPPCPGSSRGPGIFAEMGDGSAFANGSKLAAYADLAPSPPVRHLPGRETRSARGNHLLKNGMFLPCSLPCATPASKAFYDCKRAEGKGHNPPSSAAAARSSWPYSAPVSLTTRPGRHPAKATGAMI